MLASDAGASGSSALVSTEAYGRFAKSQIMHACPHGSCVQHRVCLRCAPCPHAGMPADLDVTDGSPGPSTPMAGVGVGAGVGTPGGVLASSVRYQGLTPLELWKKFMDSVRDQQGISSVSVMPCLI